MNIYVVGGGDSAMEEANYLTHFASKVTIINRREELRASKIMIERAKANPKIDWKLNYVIDEFLGEDKNGFPSLTSLRLRNTKTDELEEVQADGVFYAIGHIPNTKVFVNQLDMDASGYLITKPDSSHTNIEGIFACGDVQDSVYRQAITAAGSGCMAAIDAERWLSEHS
jgi:thioredoxin reductase (NADPH)